MISILTKKLATSKLTPQQKQIADYFLKNQERVGNMSSLDIAKEIGVSDASIIRFSRAIGYQGFADLKNDIYNSLAEEVNASIRTMRLSERFDIQTEKYPSKEISDAFLKLMNYNITKTFHQNNESEYEHLADNIIASDRKFITGLRGCVGVAASFSRLLGFTVNKVMALPHNEAEAIAVMQDIEEGDIFILFSIARYYKSDVKFIELAK